jgi:hypothetical protein
VLLAQLVELLKVAGKLGSRHWHTKLDNLVNKLDNKVYYNAETATAPSVTV